MAEISSHFLPVSHLFENVRIPGFQSTWASECDHCRRECEKSSDRSLRLCSYGVNYYHISESVLLFGFLVEGFRPTPAYKKAIKKNRSSLVRLDVIEKTVSILQRDRQTFSNMKTAALEKIIDEYKANAMYKTDLLETLKPQIRESLSFLHDYRQFVSRVTQNINVVLQRKYPNDTLDSQLQRAQKEEAAIYWSAKLMEDKLQTTLWLSQPERISALPKSNCRLHGLVHKHFKIYEVAFADKEIRAYENGQSIGEILASKAFSVIPHTLLDNALKYSSRGGQVVLNFEEDDRNITMSVTSHGPKIEVSELTTIFEPFKRGAAGQAQEEEGSGIGLYLAQMVAIEHGTQILVRQNPQRTRFGYETVFSIVLRRSDRP
jgi:signal transduction histidine kinase